MFNLFKKKEPEIQSVNSPISGLILNLEAVPDPVFSGKMVGDGFAVEPSDGLVYAPVGGELVQLFPTKHAFGIRTEAGLEVLVHVGIDTVQLKGEGFTAHAQTGEHVTQGQLILTADLEVLKAAGKSAITPVIVTNMTEVERFNLNEDMINQTVTPAGVVLKVSLK